MAISPVAVTLARESRGWSQKDLSNALNISQARLSKYEIGLLPIPPEELASIARVLKYDISFFNQADLILGLGGDFLYRKRAALPARAKRRIEAEANIRRIQLSRLLNAAKIENQYDFPAIQPEEFDGRVDLIAQEVRNAWRIQDGPIRNVTRVIENAGGVIFTIDFGTDLIDGTNMRVPSTPPLLFVNSKVSGERHRFNLAHELAHTVMHFAASMGDAEDEADRFAQEFLMPKSAIKSDLKNLDLAAAARLKAFWGVSMAAIIRRARDLKQISEAKYSSLFRMLSGSGLRRHEPLPVEFEKPEAFDKLVDIYRTAYGYSDEDINALLFTEKFGEIEVPNPPKLHLTSGLFDQEIEDDSEKIEQNKGQQVFSNTNLHIQHDSNN